MDQWLKENMQSFMTGLEVVLVGGTLMVFVLYFSIKRKIKKSKIQNNKK